MRLIEYLSIPYILVAETYEREDGLLGRRVAYPELPDCRVECESVPEGLLLLEAKRVRILLGLLKRAEPVPVPRMPVLSGDTVQVLEEIGLRERLAEWLPADEGMIARSQIEA